MQRRAALAVAIIAIMSAVTLPVSAYIYTLGTQTVTQTVVKTTYNPSDYNLLGGTALVSGSIDDLTQNDDMYMTFHSHFESMDAFIAYRDSATTLNTAKQRIWGDNDPMWGSQTAMPTTGSPVRYTRVAYSPIEGRMLENIVVTLSNDGYLDAYVWNGDSWTITSNIGFPGTTANAYKCFDVTYEKTSGRGLLVYSRGTTTNEIGYRIWTYGSGWGAEQLLNLQYTSGIVRWVNLVSAPGTRLGIDDDNEIALIYLDANADVHGYIWTGSAWSLMGASAVWDTTAAIATEECVAVAYEQQSGRAMFVWGDSVATDNYNRIWDGNLLSASTLGPDITTQGAVTNWVTLKPNPASNELMYLVVDGGSDLNTAYWSGGAWTVHSEHDASVDTHAQRCADFSWEPTESKGILVWGTTTGVINWKLYAAPNTWPNSGSSAMAGGTHPWVQLRTNTDAASNSVKVLGAVLTGTVFDIGALRWDGTTFTVIGTNTISSDTTVITYECFEFEFINYQQPAESTVELELTGLSNIRDWSELTWGFDLSWTLDEVLVTIQVYDYGTGSYPNSGDGYYSYTSSTANLDETISQVISMNPVSFRDAEGNWKIKITGFMPAGAFNLKVDWAEYKCKIANT
jgi:hypothetical protein